MIHGWKTLKWWKQLLWKHTPLPLPQAWDQMCLLRSWCCSAVEILTPLTADTLWKPAEVRKSHNSPGHPVLGKAGALKNMEEMLEKLEVVEFPEYVYRQMSGHMLRSPPNVDEYINKTDPYLLQCRHWHLWQRLTSSSVIHLERCSEAHTWGRFLRRC